MKTYEFEKMLNKVSYRMPKIKRRKVVKPSLFTEYRDTLTSFTMAFILLIVLVIGSIPPAMTVSADNSWLSTEATIEVKIEAIKP
jgi:hypothetical protein